VSRSIRRVVLTHDLGRGPLVGLPDPTANVRWLAAGLAPICQKLGLKLSVLAGTEVGGDFDTAALYASAYLEPSIEDCVTLFSGPWPRQTIELVGRAVGAEALVLGFGLSPAMIRALRRRKTPFIDLEIHPVRFARDLYLRARTADPHAASALEAIAGDDDTLAVDAALHQANARLFGGGERYAAAGNVALFAGQARFDASLVKNGRLTSPEDYLADIQQIAAAHDLMLVRPHPYESDNSHLAPLLRTIPNSILVEDSTYALLTEVSLRTVVALSSSVLHEAAIMGKATRRLLTPDVALESLADAGLKEFRIGPAIFSTRFWASVTGQFAQKGRPARSEPDAPGALRYSYGRGWGMDRPGGSSNFPLLTVGGCVEAADTAAFAAMLASGWNVAESAGAWSRLDTATICLRLAPDVQAVSIQLSDGIAAWRPGVEFSACLADRRRSPADLQTFGLTSDPLEIVLPVEPGVGFAAIHLSCSAPLTPSDGGYVPADPRRLGVLLHKVASA
jgi:hypothetical protein